LFLHQVKVSDQRETKSCFEIKTAGITASAMRVSSASWEHLVNGTSFTVDQREGLL